MRYIFMPEVLCQTLPPVWSMGELGQMEIFEKPESFSGNLLGLSQALLGILTTVQFRMLFAHNLITSAP